MADEKGSGTPEPLSPWPNVRKRWDDAGLGTLAGSFDLKLAQVAPRHSSEQIAAILHWLEALNDEDPACALAVADRLDLLFSRMGD